MSIEEVRFDDVVIKEVSISDIQEWLDKRELPLKSGEEIIKFLLSSFETSDKINSDLSEALGGALDDFAKMQIRALRAESSLEKAQKELVIKTLENAKGVQVLGDVRADLEKEKEKADKVKELERKRGACEVCWTVSWEPIEKIEDANGVNTIGPDHLSRCGYCWMKKRLEERIKELEIENNKKDEILHAIGKHFPMALIGVGLLEEETQAILP